MILKNENMITSKRPVRSIEPMSKLADLIHSDHRLLLTVSLFGIPFGVRDKTVQEICQQYHVDMECLIAIMRLLANPGGFETQSFMHLSPISIVDYLKNSHIYFLEKRLPDIQQRLSEILEGIDDVSRTSVLNFFNEYYKEVQEHMGYENQTVFPYVEKLVKGESPSGFTIDEFESHHSNIHEKLVDLKNIIIKYMELPTDNYKIANVLLEIFQSEEDIDAHCFIEDELLVAIVRKIEKELM